MFLHGCRSRADDKQCKFSFMNATPSSSPSLPVPHSFLEYLRSFLPGIVIVLTWLGAGDVVDMGVAGSNYGYSLMLVLVVDALLGTSNQMEEMPTLRLLVCDCSNQPRCVDGQLNVRVLPLRAKLTLVG